MQPTMTDKKMPQSHSATASKAAQAQRDHCSSGLVKSFFGLAANQYAIEGRSASKYCRRRREETLINSLRLEPPYVVSLHSVKSHFLSDFVPSPGESSRARIP